MTKHRLPWTTGAIQTVPFDDDVWELYDTSTDWTQAHDLSGEMPDKLHELQRLWLIEAARYNVIPLDDRVAERGNPALAGRPTLVRGNRQLLFSGMLHLPDNCVVSVLNKTHAVTAEVEVPEDGAAGVIIARGAGSAAGASTRTRAGPSTATTS